MKLYIKNEKLRESICNVMNDFITDNPYSIAIYSFCINNDFDVEVIETNDKNYRGECDYNKITMYFSQYETVESMTWLFLHELGHMFIQHSEVIKGMLHYAKRQDYEKKGIGSKVKVYWLDDKYDEFYNSDEGHESDLEEHIVSEFATYVIGKDYSRAWWRNQIV